MKKILMILGIGLFACLLTLSSRAINPVSSVKGAVMASATHDSAAVLPAPALKDSSGAIVATNVRGPSTKCDMISYVARPRGALLAYRMEHKGAMYSDNGLMKSIVLSSMKGWWAASGVRMCGGFSLTSVTIRPNTGFGFLNTA